MATSSCKIINVVLILCYAFVRSVHNLEFSDLEAMGLACAQHKCLERMTLRHSGCKCDSACSTYQDCCVGVQGQSDVEAASSVNVICLNYGQYAMSGIYAVTTCSSDWKGPIQVKQNCEGSPDFSDPRSAAPMTSASEGVTYKNRYCAECNNADLESLEAFRSEISCRGKDDFSEEFERNEFSYNQEEKKWGIYRMDADGNSNFIACHVFFNLPDHLRRSVRFCRADVISTCPRDWPRPQVKKLCEEYVALVFDKVRAYRNPHCAICNNKTLEELSCKSLKTHRRHTSSAEMTRHRRKTPTMEQMKGKLSFTTLRNTERFGKENPECPPGHLYDPFSNRCRKLVCALPGHVVQNNKCVPGS